MGAGSKIFYNALIVSTLVLSFLPTLGGAWHRVLPEHEHWYIGGTPADRHFDSLLSVQTGALDCSGCSDPVAATGYLHLPGPNGSLQVFAIAVVLIAPFFISIPPSFSARFIAPPLLVATPFIPLLDPPPKAN